MLAGNVNGINVEKIDDIDIYEKMEVSDGRKNSVGFLAKMKKALSPRAILGFIISGLWKPILAFILFFTLFLGAVYAGGYFKLFNTREALDFEWLVADLRQTDNSVLKTALPVIEWTSTTMVAAGDLMQSHIDIQAEMVKKQEEVALIAKQEEDAKKAQEDKAKEEAKGAQQQQPSRQEQEKARKQQEAELQIVAEERQKELTKRANQLANYYSTMAPKDAVNILKNLDNDEIVLILGRMENDAASQILANFEPDRASAISKEILKLHPTTNILPSTVQGQNIL